MSPPPLDTSPKRHRRDAVRESLAGDSLDSHPIPVAQAWIALLVYCAICLGLLMRKVRAYEVVR